MYSASSQVGKWHLGLLLVVLQLDLELAPEVGVHLAKVAHGAVLKKIQHFK